MWLVKLILRGGKKSTKPKFPVGDQQIQLSKACFLLKEGILKCNLISYFIKVKKNSKIQVLALHFSLRMYTPLFFSHSHYCLLSCQITFFPIVPPGSTFLILSPDFFTSDTSQPSSLSQTGILANSFQTYTS